MTTEIGTLLTAMITPFKADGSVDYAAAEKLAAMLVADGFEQVELTGPKKALEQTGAQTRIVSPAKDTVRLRRTDFYRNEIFIWRML